MSSSAMSINMVPNRMDAVRTTGPTCRAVVIALVAARTNRVHCYPQQRETACPYAKLKSLENVGKQPKRWLTHDSAKQRKNHPL